MDSNRLERIILDRIERKGPITFAEYMDACLYEPLLGYYTSPGRRVGPEGDFYTSVGVHSIFGRLISREISRMWEVMGEPAPFTIVEQGAGSGRLAADILDGVADRNPKFYQCLCYRLIEAGPAQREVQRRVLGSHLAKIGWDEPADLAMGRFSFTGCLLSNELIDSFPVHIVEMTREGLREVYVSSSDGALAEVLGTLSTPLLAAYLEDSGIILSEDQRVEINLAALEWVGSVAKALERGFVLTIDYGYMAMELYTPMRSKGTLLCYYEHTVAEDPYIRIGQQDMTTHVDFSALIRCGEELGLKQVWFGEQYRFLMAAGMMEEMAALEARCSSEEERIKNRLAVKRLILPGGGMGDTFKVLIQAKGVEDPQLLCLRGWE